MKSKMYWVTKLIRRPELPKTVIDEVHTGGYCKNCGKELVQLPGNHRIKVYCSTKCRVAWWHAHKVSTKISRKEIVVGAYCKKEFEVYAKQDRKYCSRQCYVKDRFGK